MSIWHHPSGHWRRSITRAGADSSSLQLGHDGWNRTEPLVTESHHVPEADVSPLVTCCHQGAAAVGRMDGDGEYALGCDSSHSLLSDGHAFTFVDKLIKWLRWARHSWRFCNQKGVDDLFPCTGWVRRRKETMYQRLEFFERVIFFANFHNC